MISIKRYLEGEPARTAGNGQRKTIGTQRKDLVSLCVEAYRSALAEMGRSSIDACPALGSELQTGLAAVMEGLATEVNAMSVERADRSTQNRLQDWGRKTARHYQKKTAEVKEILIAMAHAVESVGERDQRCAEQINRVTTQLRGIANLDDLTEIRCSIEKSASELKGSIDRLAAEGKAALQQLQAKVESYQAKLEAAEQIASFDGLTQVRSRLWVEGQIEQRMAGTGTFCTAILDIDGFKRVNDEHGHLVGDELLTQFAGELRAACRSTDVIGRWGGDEFIVLLDCCLAEGQAQIDRVSKWVCGSYTVEGTVRPLKLQVNASIGLAERRCGETMKQLVDRADAEMYRYKVLAREKGISR
jgi:diguanylate cyclase (GGDEF)-like protein